MWLKPTANPLWWYGLLTAVPGDARVLLWLLLTPAKIFWTLSVLNNMAYDFAISQPLHMVFRSSSLAVSLLLGVVAFRKSYGLLEVLGVCVVTGTTGAFGSVGRRLTGVRSGHLCDHAGRRDPRARLRAQRVLGCAVVGHARCIAGAGQAGGRAADDAGTLLVQAR